MTEGGLKHRDPEEWLGLAVSVLTFAAVILTRRRWRQFLPLWFLAAGTGVGWFADWSAEGAALGDFACLSLLLYGLGATWIACGGGMSRLISFLNRRSS